MTTERFAPSPTGFLHLGHGFSALMAAGAAKAASGRFLLRMEDIDTTRCRAEFEQAIYDDLHWLGLEWEQPVLRQSERGAIYQTALQTLVDLGLCYPCSCTRKDIATALSAPQEGAEQVFGPDGVIYPGTCRHRPMKDRTATDAVRLDIAAAIDHLGGQVAVSNLTYQEIGGARPETITLDAGQLIQGCGDIVLARKDIGTSYHLAVVVDDAEQEITHVTRGKDVAPATPVHRLLQALLYLSTPTYRHHRLIRDETGKRLAKRHDAMALRAYRKAGKTAADIREMVGL
ncbi:MAG: tRNA glutamyl-Q(34) synthetase GluQRS [Rhodobacteraceae bacterium]|nr:tRNA glutamyl-Q(34) synthetase GluQRS [Paracoccaceae bacterium]